MKIGKFIPQTLRYFNIPYDDDDYTNPGQNAHYKIKEIVKNNYYGVYNCPHLKEKKFIRLVEDGSCKPGLVPEPKIKVSNFDGCPHWYGKVFTNDGRVFEIQEKITERLLKVGKQTGGDWTGYNVGEYTNRFLSKDQLLEAFELMKEILISE